MHRVLLSAALSAVLAASAQAKSFAAAEFSVAAASPGAAATVVTGRGGVRIHRLIGVPPSSDHHPGWRGHGGFVYPYPADYDANYDIDRSWDSDSFNDWWHDQPRRAYPRWVWHNRNCSEDRMWWSGSGWRCTP